MSRTTRFLWIPLALAATVTTTAARADIRDNWIAQAPTQYQQECGSCHIPFPPQLLSADAWKAVMAQLDRHYGDNAEIPADTAQAITAYLVRWAGPERKVGSPPGNPPRLTQTRYFQEEHRKIPRAIWSRSDVRSPANCGACHQQADRGIFDDETIKLPGVEKWREND